MSIVSMYGPLVCLPVILDPNKNNKTDWKLLSACYTFKAAERNLMISCVNNFTSSVELKVKVTVNKEKVINIGQGGQCQPGREP